MPTQKWYVVWKGRRRGIFRTWEECETQVKGFTGAQFKAFSSRNEAARAFATPYSNFEGRPASHGRWKTAAVKPVVPSVCADAACDGSPGKLEYRLVRTETAEQILKAGPFADGTNNVGEFLAIVEALRWLRSHKLKWPVYSDSSNAIAWIGAKKCNTKLRRTRANERLFSMIAAAESDLRMERLLDGDDRNGTKVLKWRTEDWGEIPADFGRK